MIKVDETDPVGELEPSFPYRDVHIRRNVQVKEFYDLQSEIGRGKFGTVYRCREKSTGLSLAAKIVSVARKEDRRNVEREVDIMRSLQHPRLLQLYDAFEFDKEVCLILELIEGGELFERVIDDDFVLTEKACTVFMRQICEGINFIHQQHILHLDLKPENILCLTKTGNRIKIIDFGLARRYEPGKKLQVLFGTPEFVAPEVVNFDQIGFNTDMWSVGVICYVLLSGLSPFMGDTDIETMANVTIAKYDFEDEVFNDISDDAKDFISKLLVKEKEKRMCAEHCLHHPWLKRKKAPKVIKTVISNVDNRVNGSADDANNNKNHNDKNNNSSQAAKDKLDGTKDNLRNIVERWTEHPDSPYIFDTKAHTISPCPSLSSMGPEADVATPEAGTSPPDGLSKYLQDRLMLMNGSERRASDSSCVVRLKTNHLDIKDRINLADEIRKLSDKLFRMASNAHNHESITVTETHNGTTTTKTTFRSSSSTLSDSFTAKATSLQIPTKRFWPIEPGRFHLDAETDVPSEAGAASSRRGSRRLSTHSRDVPLPAPLSIPSPAGPSTPESSASPTPHSLPPSPRWSPDPELPPPPTSASGLTKDLLLRLLNKLDTVDGLDPFFASSKTTARRESTRNLVERTSVSRTPVAHTNRC